jgi:hypothetical protein
MTLLVMQSNYIRLAHILCACVRARVHIYILYARLYAYYYRFLLIFIF